MRRSLSLAICRARGGETFCLCARVLQLKFDSIFQQQVLFSLVFKHWQGIIKWSCLAQLARERDADGEDLVVRPYIQLTLNSGNGG